MADIVPTPARGLVDIPGVKQVGLLAGVAAAVVVVVVVVVVAVGGGVEDCARRPSARAPSKQPAAELVLNSLAMVSFMCRSESAVKRAVAARRCSRFMFLLVG